MGDKVNIMRKDLRPDCAGPLKNQRGSAAIDYAMILVFVVLAVVAVIASLGKSNINIFTAMVPTEESGKIGINNFGKIDK